MTERDLGHSNSGRWYGKVVNVKDPDQSGRVQVRVFGRHDDEENIPDKDLPWAMPSQAVTSAALGKVGQAPLGLLKGSHVHGHWADSDHQVPIVDGSMGKSGEYKDKGSNKEGIPEIDIDKGSMPTAATNQSPPKALNPFSKLHEGRITINDINNGVKSVKDITRSTGIINNKEVDKKLKEATKPTLASIDKGNTGDILSLIKKADPNNLSATLPNMVGSFSEVKNIMNMTSPTGLTNMLGKGLQGAIGALGSQMGFGNIMGPMMGLLGGNTLPPQLQSALKSALLKGMVAGSASAMPSVISKKVPKYDPTIGKPLANLIMLASNLPPTYIQQYHELDREPYPGYIEWRDPDTSKKLYTLRGTEPHYASAEEHVTGNAAAHLVQQMAPVMKSIMNNAPGQALSVSQIAGLTSSLSKSLDLIQGQGMSKILGGGVNMSNITSLASKLIPDIAGKISGVTGAQLPKSVLDAGKVQKTMGEFTKNQALLKKKKDNMKKAMEPNADADDQTFKDYAKKQAFDKLNADPSIKSASVTVKLSDGSTFISTVER